MAAAHGCDEWTNCTSRCRVVEALHLAGAMHLELARQIILAHCSSSCRWWSFASFVVSFTFCQSRPCGDKCFYCPVDQVAACAAGWRPSPRRGVNWVPVGVHRVQNADRARPASEARGLVSDIGRRAGDRRMGIESRRHRIRPAGSFPIAQREARS